LRDVRRHFPYKRVITAVLLLAASVTLLNLTGKPKEGPSFWESAFTRISSPLYTAYSKLKNEAEYYSAAFANKNDLIRQNEELAGELDTVDALRARVAELEAETQRLKDLLQFQETTPGNYRVAKVFGRNPEKWFSTIDISLGSNDGVQVDDPVVSRTGLVGRILYTDKRTATVLLLTDPESGVGGTVEGSRDYGVVVGGNGPDTLILRFFSRDAVVQVGDKVVTSGMGSKFPPGILIGEVTSVYIPKPGLIKEATVKPASVLNHLEEVMVVQQ
jgi:rod shape-determining protein MreC